MKGILLILKCKAEVEAEILEDISPQEGDMVDKVEVAMGSMFDEGLRRLEEKLDAKSAAADTRFSNIKNTRVNRHEAGRAAEDSQEIHHLARLCCWCS